MKQDILTKITQLNQLAAETETLCREYCANQDITVAERWEVFKVAPNKKHSSSDKIPYERDLGCEEISPYDDFGLERRETFNVVEEIETWEKYKGEWWSALSEDGKNAFKNYYMTQYLGSWQHDW